VTIYFDNSYFWFMQDRQTLCRLTYEPLSFQQRYFGWRYGWGVS